MAETWERDEVAQVRAELYRGEPSDFMARRTELAKQARADGDRELAAAIAAVRKPSASAFLLNRWAADNGSAVAELHELGDEFRSAQGNLDARELRELAARRRSVVDRGMRAVVDSNDSGTVSESIRQEIASTLNAAIADPAIADLLESALLERAATWDGGFGGTAAGGPMLTLVHSLPPDPARQNREAQRPLVTGAPTAVRGAPPTQDEPRRAERRLQPAPKTGPDEVGSARDAAARRAELAAARAELAAAERAVRQAITRKRETQAALGMAERRLAKVELDHAEALAADLDAARLGVAAEKERGRAQAMLDRLT